MRHKLKQINNERSKFRGKFVRYGSKKNWKGFTESTVLLAHIEDEDGTRVTDHLWFNMTKSFSELGDIKEGTLIEFEARVTEYTKGYVIHRDLPANRKKDYKLSRPTRIKVVKND